ncbi:DoxX family protein [Capnocytophaga canimorsus]|nr:membrane protein [Capnocytophaga canimorsus]WGU69438.1 hypothetical protein QIU19_07305 [Capnocytophaga canimorsus]WGU71439.1 hypothetical protein QIU18_06435 [Capnocytophaga canimorsus]
MIPLLLLFSVFLLTFFGLKWLKKKNAISISGRLALSIMFLFTATGHFFFTKGMAMMIPEFLPYKIEIVYVTGVLELLFSVGILLPKTRKLTAWSIIIFLFLVLPANIYASLHHINYQTATFDGNGTDYLWFRIPMQLLLVFWTYFFCLKKHE